MAIGSLNRQHRKDFQHVAGGPKWRSKIMSAQQASELLQRLEMLDQNNYVESKKKEIVMYQTYKQTVGMYDPIDLQQWRDKYY